MNDYDKILYETFLDKPQRYHCSGRDLNGEFRERKLSETVIPPIPIMEMLFGSDDEEDFTVTKVLVNEQKGATTVFFADDDVIVVKRAKDTTDSLYNAVASAIAIKVHGSNTQFKKVLENVEYIKKGKKHGK